ncbi:MAG: hypothetical protein KF778_17130 [Rhodocyclaceae bacterium]|nr:hypothetical protein [Rhodocyclaceae bacterium]
MLKRLLWGLIVLAAFAIAIWKFQASPSQSQPPAMSSKLAILYNAEEQPGEKTVLAQLIQAQLKKAGMEVSLEPVPSTVYNDRVGKGEFDIVLSLWYLDYNDAEGYLTDFYSKAGYRLSRYSNSAYDEAYLSALFSSTEAQKLTRYAAVAKIIDDAKPWIPLFSNNEIFLMSPAAQGFQSNAFQYYDYRQVELPAIRTATDTEVQTLDPAQTYDLASKHIVTQSYEGLIAMDGNDRIVPALAKSWTVSPNADAITFDLRPGVHFHPAAFLGTQLRTLTSADVKATFERLIKANSPYGYIFDHVAGVQAFKDGQVKGVEGFVADAPLRFTIKLTKPLQTMLPWLLAPAAYILPADLPEKYDFSKESCGTGPFVLTGWDGAQATFKANAGYWARSQDGRALPRAKLLTIRVVKDPNVQLLALKQGQLDIINVSLPLLDTLLDADGKLKSNWSQYSLREVKLNNLKFLGFNMQSTHGVASLPLRQGIDSALDKQAIVAQLLHGKARAARSVVPAEMLAAPQP